MAQISSTGRLGRALRGSAGALAILGMGFALAAPASAEKVGIAAAVNPDAFSSLSGSPQSQLSIGKSIFFNERINTTTSGLVQVLLADGSTFTVGPGSDLVIDKFVYDPRKKSGEVVATFSKGVMRFVGGKISKNEGGVTVNTPSGALAIRGGMFQGKIGGGNSLFSFLYGVNMTFTGKNGKTFDVYEPGYTLEIGGSQGNVRPTTPQDTNAFMAALTNSNKGGIGNQTNPGTPNNIEQVTQLQNDTTEMVSDANTIIIQTEIEKQIDRLEQPTPPAPTGPVTGGEETPPPVDTRTAAVFDGYAVGFRQNGEGAPDFVSSSSADGVHIELTPETDSFTAGIKVSHSELNQYLRTRTTTYTLGFTGSGPVEYKSNEEFGVLNKSGAASILQTEKVGWFRPTDVTHNYNGLTHTGTFINTPQTESVPTSLCATCGFLKWGTWASNFTYGQQPKTDQMGGWWVATNQPISSNNMPTTGTAKYEGLAVGTFTSRSENWQQRVATGDLNMTWNFGHRVGTLKVDDFAGKDFGGVMVAKGGTGFTGPLIGSGLAVGQANGSFVGPDGTNYPKGVMGNFGVGNNSWKANGIFGAGLVQPN